MNTAAIEVADVTKSYNRGKVRALDGISLTVQPGEVFGLIGPNGAGKSSLMGLLLGLLMPTSGTISVFGRSAFELSIRQVTGYLPERPYFDAWMTPWQFLRYHHMLVKRPDSEADEAIDQALRKVALDPDTWKRPIKKLSRGTLQRLGLAQVLIGKPLICFLDEPDSGMDPLGTALVRTLIAEWKKQGCTILLNSHHLDEVEKTCDRVAFIKKGKITTIRSLDGSMPTETFMRFKWQGAEDSPDENALVGAKCVLQAFEAKYGAQVKEIGSEHGIVTLPDKQLSTDMIKDLLDAGVALQEAVIEKQSLEDIFVQTHGDNAQK